MRALIIAASMTLMSEAAVAQPASFDVPISDLNLSQPAGMKELESRFLHKMHITCGRVGDVWVALQPESGKQFRACVAALTLGEGEHPAAVSQAFERARVRMVKPN